MFYDMLLFNLLHLVISKSGDNGTEATPVPISNTEVKLRCADGTWRAAAWESKSSPVLIFQIISFKQQRRGVEQLAARRAHNPEVAGSNPVSATINFLAV